MKPSVFLSHNTNDKNFARKLALDLECQGVKVWIDEAELKVGDSLIEKIREGIDKVDYVVAILSSNSIASAWVKKELDVAMTLEINGKQIKVLPLMLEQCDPPGFLLGKFYADFTHESNYIDSFELLMNSMGLVLNKSALLGKTKITNLDQATKKASDRLLLIYPKPFYRPFQYIGMTLSDAAKAVNGKPNKAGSIVIDSEDCHMFLEAEGNYISYVEVDLKKTEPCIQNQEFDSDPILGSFSINPSELDLIYKKAHYHKYYDHKRKLKVSVTCSFDGGPLSVGFSSKYYGM